MGECTLLPQRPRLHLMTGRFPFRFAGGSYERTDDGSQCGSVMPGGRPGANSWPPCYSCLTCPPNLYNIRTYILVRVSEIGLTVKGESPAARLSTHRNPYLRCAATEPLGCRPTNNGCRCRPRRCSAKRAGSVRRLQQTPPRVAQRQKATDSFWRGRMRLGSAARTGVRSSAANVSPMTLMLITPPDVCVLVGTTHVTATAASTGAVTSVRVGERKILQVGAE